MRWKLPLALFASLLGGGASSVARAQDPEPVAESSAVQNAAPSLNAQIAQAVARLNEASEAGWVAARDQFQALSQTYPQRADLWYNLGVARRKLGNLSLASEAFAHATSADASFADGWQGWAVTAIDMGDLNAAMTRIERGLAVSPDHEGLIVAQVRALRLTGRTSEAIEVAKRAIRSHALSFALYHEMGLACLARGDIDLARFIFEKAEMIPGGEKNALIQGDFGLALSKLGQTYAAALRLERAVELDAQNLSALVALAQIRYADRDYEAMVKLLEMAKAVEPENPDILLNLGVAYLGLGRDADAKAAWLSARQVRPSDPTPLFNLGVLEVEREKDYQGAVAQFQAYIDEGGVQSERAQAYIKDTNLERQRVERKARVDSERKQREEEAARQRALLEQSQQQVSPPQDSPWGAAPAGGSTPAPESGTSDAQEAP